MSAFFRLKPLARALSSPLPSSSKLSTNTLLALTLMLPMSAMVQAQELEFNIPAQPLDKALQAFGKQSNLQLLYSPEQVKGFTSSAIKGRLSASTAIDKLLSNTGIDYKIDGNIVTLTQDSSAGTVLKTVTVKDQISDTTTEGTGSYTTRATAASTGLALSLRDTPQSVSVITRQRIDDQALLTLKDVLANAPGVASSQLDSERTTFSARGFSIDQLQYDGISTFYDSAYAGGESEASAVIYDRIEIVHGAAGLLTGAGQPSASINLIRKHADSREFKGTVSASVGSWNNYHANVDVSTPLSSDGDVRGRFVYAREDKDSFINRYNRKSDTVYGVVDVDLTPSTTVSVGVSYERSDANAITYGGQPAWYSDGSTTNFSRSFSFAPKWSYENTDIINGFVDLDHQFDNGWTLKGLFMRGRNKVDNARLFLWDFPNPITGEVGVVDYDLGIDGSPSIYKGPGARNQTSTDVRLSGPFELAGREHEAIIGLNYFDQTSKYYYIGSASEWTTTNIYTLPDLPKQEWADPFLSSEGHIKQSAVFGALRLSLADPLKLILGGRVTRVERDGYSFNYSYPYDYDITKFVPYAGLVYDLTSNLSAYASYTSIFKPQDYRDTNGNWLDPVTGDAYEVGLKGEFFEGGLNASIAVFKITQDRLAQPDGVAPEPSGATDPNTGDPITFDAYRESEGATSKGVELELNGQLATGWNLSFNVAHFKAEDVDGEDVNTNYPRTTVNLFTTYKLPGQWQKLTIGGGANWQSGVYYENLYPTPYDGARVTQSAYLVGNLMARYAFTEQLSGQLNLNNVFDKKYETAINWYGQQSWGAPRNFLASLTYKF